MEGCTDGRSRDYYVTTKISWLDTLPNLFSNGAPLAHNARGLCFKFTDAIALFFSARRFSVAFI